MFYEKISEKWENATPEMRKAWEKIQWVATEKIHGANFSIHISIDIDATRKTPTKKIQFAKRKEMLQWEDDFFNYQTLTQDLSVHSICLFEVLEDYFLAKNIFLDKLIIYGELCGGEYPHPEVEKYAHLQAIQTGVYYANDIQFFVFDVRVFTKDGIFYLDYKDFLYFLKQTNFHIAPHFLVDKLHKILQFDLDIPTQVPQLLGLPALSTPNFIEGIVIKPYQHSVLGEENAENPRPIFKLKRKEFLENPAYQEAKKWEKNTPENIFWQDVDFWVTEILPYLNKNRLQNTISKLGNTQNTNAEQHKERAIHWVKDALESFVEENKSVWTEIPTQTQDNILQKLIFEAISKISLPTPKGGANTKI